MADAADTPRRGRGRPPLLDLDMTRRIAALVAAGNYVEAAAASCGVSHEACYNWLRTGMRLRRALSAIEDDDAADAAFDALTPHEQNMVEYSEAIEKAEGDWEIVAVTRVNKAGQDGAWQADMTRLERRKPKRWGRREAVEVTGQVDGVHINATADTPKEAVAMSTALQDERARAAAADLIEALSGTPSGVPQGDDDDEQPDP